MSIVLKLFVILNVIRFVKNNLFSILLVIMLINIFGCEIMCFNIKLLMRFVFFGIMFKVSVIGILLFILNGVCSFFKLFVILCSVFCMFLDFFIRLVIYVF